MSIKPTTDRAAMVDTKYHYLDAKEYPPPTGPRILCIDRRAGVAVISNWMPDAGFTHWAPLPTFEKETT